MSQRRIARISLAIAAIILLAAPAQRLQADNADTGLRQRVTAAIAADVTSAGRERPMIGELEILPRGLQLPEHAKLRAVSSQPGFEPETWLIRMDCIERRDCLPFHVLVHSAAREFARLDNRTAPSSASSFDHRSAKLHGNDPLALAHSGDHVVVVQELPGMRLQARAVCLQSGRLGDTILVRNLTSHRVLLATIAGKTEVRVE